MLIFDESRITLKQGHTITEYIIAANAINTSYTRLCNYLKMPFAEVRAMYDKIYNLPLSDIGETKRLQTVKTGTDWRKANANT